MTPHSNRRCTASTATVVVFSAAMLLLNASALAQDVEVDESTASKGVPCPALKDIHVVGTGNTVCRPISTAWTHIFLPENAEVRSQQNPPGFTIRDSKGLMEIVAHSGAPPGTETAIKISVPGRYIATFIARAVPTASQALGQYTVSHLTEAQAFAIAKAETRAKHLAADRARDQARIQELERQSADQEQERHHARRRTQASEERARGFEQQAKASEQRAEAAEQKALSLETELSDTKAQVQTLQRTTEDKVDRAVAIATSNALRHDLRNQGKDLYTEAANSKYAKNFLQPMYSANTSMPELLPARWDNDGKHILQPIRVHNTDAHPLRLPPPHVEAGGQPLASYIDYVDQVVPVDERLVASGEKVGAILVIPADPGKEPVDVAIKWGPLDIRLSQWILRTVQYEKTPRDRFFQRIRENEQVIIAPRFVGGAFWVPNGLVGEARRLDPTWFAGGGLRLTKGFNETFAFEGEVVGGTTGEASFQQGSRSGKFGRVQIGGALRFGHDRVPIARVGLGVLGAFYDSTPETGESSEYTGLIILGLGYAKRYSEQWLLSASATAILQGAEELRTFELGLQIGYGFKPGYTPK